ncbi:MAG TPA: nickel-type superoxide dismutase maturation protease [Leptolyngbyaceae cyanobacterium M65_K2018_010]|nr:nickel-type superoxide dismutase maturation protease [Leptolyngbyaceae cyanobacterium M65_K2018_010]
MAASAPPPVLPPQTLRSSQIADLLGWWLGRRRRFRVIGQSMQPLLQPGEEVLINPQAYRQRLPQPGDLVVAQHPGQPDLRLIKWVAYRQGEACFLRGLNETASTDSRTFGPVGRAALLGQVICRLP